MYIQQGKWLFNSRAVRTMVPESCQITCTKRSVSAHFSLWHGKLVGFIPAHQVPRCSTVKLEVIRTVMIKAHNVVGSAGMLPMWKSGENDMRGYMLLCLHCDVYPARVQYTVACHREGLVILRAHSAVCIRIYSYRDINAFATPYALLSYIIHTFFVRFYFMILSFHLMHGNIFSTWHYFHIIAYKSTLMFCHVVHIRCSMHSTARTRKINSYRGRKEAKSDC